MQSSFTIREAISFAWTRAKGNWLVLGLLFISAMAIGGLLNQVTEGLGGENVVLIVVLNAISTIVSLYVSAVLLKASLLESRGVKIAWKSSWKIEKIILGRLILANIVIGIIFGLLGTILGLVFVTSSVAMGDMVARLIVVAFILVAIIYLAVRLNFANYSVVDGGVTALGSIQKSWSITRGNFWKLIGLVLLLVLINLVGLLALFVGVFFTAPLAMIALAYAYDRLSGHGATVTAPPSETTAVPSQGV